MRYYNVHTQIFHEVLQAGNCTQQNRSSYRTCLETKIKKTVEGESLGNDCAGLYYPCVGLGRGARWSLVRMPWSAGRPLAPKEWDAFRMRVIFDCCKWDIQSEDQSVLADFPLFIEEDEWRTLAKLAEKLTTEVLDAEQELILSADLHP